MTSRRPVYVPTQPQRCAGGEVGRGGACLSCGARPGDLCKAPPAHRYGAREGRRA